MDLHKDDRTRLLAAIETLEEDNEKLSNKIKEMSDDRVTQVTKLSKKENAKLQAEQAKDFEQSIKKREIIDELLERVQKVETKTEVCGKDEEGTKEKVSHEKIEELTGKIDAMMLTDDKIRTGNE